MLAMGRVWEKLQLDYLLLTSYAAGDSKLSPIEHAWAPVTMWCTGLVLDCKLPGEAVCPNRQSGLSDAEKKTKNTSVFEQSMHKVQSVLHGRKYNGHPISVIPVNYEEATNEPAETLSKIASKQRLSRSTPDVKREAEKLSFYSRHCNQEFVRCEDCDHCKSFSAVALKLMELVKNGGMFRPRPSVRDEHYTTFDEELISRRLGQAPLLIDQGLPSKPNMIIVTKCSIPKLIRSDM